MLPFIIAHPPFALMYLKISGKKVRQQAPWIVEKLFQRRQDIKQDITYC